MFVVATDRRIGTYATVPWYMIYPNLTDVRLVSGTYSFPRVPYSPTARDKHSMYLEAKKCLGSFVQPGADNGINMTDYLVLFLNF